MNTQGIIRIQNTDFPMVLDQGQQDLSLQPVNIAPMIMVVQSQNALLGQEAESLHAAFLKYQEKMKESLRIIAEENARLQAELVASNARYDELNMTHQVEQKASGNAIQKLKQEAEEKTQKMTELPRKIRKLRQDIREVKNLKQQDAVAIAKLQTQLSQSSFKLKQEIMLLEKQIKVLEKQDQVVEQLNIRRDRVGVALINIEREISHIENSDALKSGFPVINFVDGLIAICFEHFKIQLKDGLAKCRQHIQHANDPIKA